MNAGTTRWWENYLVRYLMPSIAGVVIVNWLCSHGGSGFRTQLLIPSLGERLDTASITLLFLYGNLFCYVSSYPVLTFHATRVLDFSNDHWIAKPYLDGYLSALVLAALAFVLFHDVDPEHRFWLAFVLTVFFVGLQLARIALVLFQRIRVRGCSGLVTPAYGYVYALARRRGIPSETETTGPVDGDSHKPEGIRAGLISALKALRTSPRDAQIHEALNTFADAEEEITTVREIIWRRDFMDTYRHLREHGNSAFTFLLELALAALVYCVITKPGQSPPQQLGATGALFAIWATPAVFVHLLGQHLERRFSHFDRRIALGKIERTTEASGLARTGATGNRGVEASESGLNDGERFAVRFCQKLGLRAERFDKVELRSGKTPDFRVYKGEQLVFYCEAKHIQYDDWLDKQLDDAEPVQIVGGLRPDPIFNRIAGHVHEAAKQFRAVNPDRQFANVLVFTNSDSHCRFSDLVSTLTGNFYGESGSVDPIYKNISEGRIREEKFTIDLYVWFDESEPEKRRIFFNESSPHYAGMCMLLGSDPKKHRRV